MKKILFLVICLIGLGASVTSYGYVSNNYVMYNVNTHIYHKPNCKWAIKCTLNCIMIKKEEAVKMGRPCKVCGG